MTAPGGGGPYPDQPGQWPQYQHPPVDPQAPVNYPPVNYPEYPYTGPQPVQPPQPPPYGAPIGYGAPPPPPYGGPAGYGAPPPTYSQYDPYQTYPPRTNGLAVASLCTSIGGLVLGIPLSIFCYVGWLIPVVGAVLGAIALGQIKQRGEQGRGMAIAGIAIGAGTAALLVLVLIVAAAAAFHAPMFGVI